MANCVNGISTQNMTKVELQTQTRAVHTNQACARNQCLTAQYDGDLMTRIYRHIVIHHVW